MEKNEKLDHILQYFRNKRHDKDYDKQNEIWKALAIKTCEVNGVEFLQLLTKIEADKYIETINGQKYITPQGEEYSYLSEQYAKELKSFEKEVTKITDSELFKLKSETEDYQTNLHSQLKNTVQIMMLRPGYDTLKLGKEKEFIDTKLHLIELEEERRKSNPKESWLKRKVKEYWLLVAIFGYIGGFCSPVFTDIVRSAIQGKTLEQKTDTVFKNVIVHDTVYVAKPIQDTIHK